MKRYLFLILLAITACQIPVDQGPQSESHLAASLNTTVEPGTSETKDSPYEKALEGFGLAAKMDQYGVPGISFAVIKDGKIDWAKGYGVLQNGTDDKVNTETVFSVGSVSKVGAAVISLKLHEKGILNIDEDVNDYLVSWKVPQNVYTQDQAVTLRHIMSHTGGLTVHGFADFLPDEKLPRTVQILKGEWPAKNGPVYVSAPVGSAYRYSGGGTTVEQLVFEDLLKLPLHKVAENYLFQPLNMKRSSYENPLPFTMGNIAKAHDRRGNPVALPRGYQSMPEAAASGLWTTPSDFAKLMIMLMHAHEGKSHFLKQSTAQDMMTPVFPSDYGLGPHIKKEGTDIQFSHGGSNDSYKARFIGSLSKQNGVVIFTNGAAGSDLIKEVLPVLRSLEF